MTWGEVAQLITAVVVAAAFIRGEMRGRATLAKVEEVRAATNGLVTKMGDAKQAQGDAEGHERGLQQGREEKGS